MLGLESRPSVRQPRGGRAPPEGSNRGLEMPDRPVGSSNVAGQYWHGGCARAPFVGRTRTRAPTSSAIGLFRGIVPECGTATVFIDPSPANFHTEAGAGASDAAGRANDYPIESIAHRDWKMTPARSGAAGVKLYQIIVTRRAHWTTFIFVNGTYWGRLMGTPISGRPSSSARPAPIGKMRGVMAPCRSDLIVAILSLVALSNAEKRMSSMLDVANWAEDRTIVSMSSILAIAKDM
ncbi:hypothetical protein MSG28_003744 [Choristoneura fumiferana]|uniref:Uncharacterized protein n=1 Tax=Choristoneura fumiferana TaxID=7141 RepID=A0ACC0KGR8_CHOFU|nr:hypothetical protein MSG28_003744 [Choristoneura fumiferana]